MLVLFLLKQLLNIIQLKQESNSYNYFSCFVCATFPKKVLSQRDTKTHSCINNQSAPIIAMSFNSFNLLPSWQLELIFKVLPIENPFIFTL